MKRYLSLTIFLLAFSSFGQQVLVFDNTFGNNGTKLHEGIAFYPEDGLLINNNYYFVSNNSIGKVDYSGNFVSGFGQNGIKQFNTANNTFTIRNFKYINNYFYLSGSITSGVNQDAFVCKIDESGNFDTAFGTNGVARFDFSAQENIVDFIVESNVVFCVGTRDQKLMYLKLNTNGSLNFNFDATGYKLSTLDYTSGNSIHSYNNNYLLTGTLRTTIGNNAFIYDVLLMQIDANGNLVTGFGNNGYKTFDADSGSQSYTLNKAQLYNNSLYISYYRSWSFLDQNSALLRYDLNTDQLVFNNIYHSGMHYFKVENDALYISGYNRCTQSSIDWCHRTFTFSKKNLDGTLDSTFNNNSIYNYSFPTLMNYDSQSSLFIRDNDGKTLIAGYVYRNYLNANNTWIHVQGFSMIRLGEGTLENTDFESNNVFSVSPVPAKNTLTITAQQDVLISSISFYNTLGQLLQVIDNPDETVDVSNLKTGSYFIKILSDKGTATAKFVKE